MSLIILHKPSIDQRTAISELYYLFREIVDVSLVNFFDYLVASVTMHLACQLYDGFNIEGFRILLGIDVLLEHYIKGGLRVVIVKVIQEKVTIVADSSYYQVK